MDAKLTRTAKAKFLSRVTELTGKINRCRYIESLGDASPTATGATFEVARANAREAYSDRAKLTAELRGVCSELLGQVKPSTINGYSLMGEVVRMVETGEWSEDGRGNYTMLKSAQVAI